MISSFLITCLTLKASCHQSNTKPRSFTRPRYSLVVYHGTSLRRTLSRNSVSSVHAESSGQTKRWNNGYQQNNSGNCRQNNNRHSMGGKNNNNMQKNVSSVNINNQNELVKASAEPRIRLRHWRERIFCSLTCRQLYWGLPEWTWPRRVLLQDLDETCPQ